MDTFWQFHSCGGVPPKDAEIVGKIDRDDVAIYVARDVSAALERFAEQDVTAERGAFLLGSHGVQGGRPFVVVSAFVEAQQTEATAISLTFTQQTWTLAHAEREQKYPDLQMVGWQHTHPNLGVFLSNYDLFIHRNFFDLPFQIAYVIDPVRHTFGLFAWKNGEVQQANGYAVF